MSRLIRVVVQRIRQLGSRALLLSSILFIGACAGGGDNDASNNTTGISGERDFDFTAMMANYADNIILAGLRSFNSSFTGIDSIATSAISEYCDAIGSTSEASALGEAQLQWRNAMNLWQRQELLILGPLAENGNARRNAVYSYASSAPPNTCSVDRSVALAQNSEFDIQARAFTSRGLDALEYLLFNENLDHTCASQVAETQNWNALAELERKTQRCEYAEQVASDIGNSSNVIIDAWAFDGGDFRTQFVNSVNANENLKRLSDAIFYFEIETKDTKLGMPTGLHANCRGLACPLAVESPHSQSSLANIRENLHGFHLALNGGDGLGFDDIIIAEGASFVVDNFNLNISAALALISEMDTSLLNQSQGIVASGDGSACGNSAANPDTIRTVPICSLHGYLKRITDSLRSDFLVIVDLDLPQRGQSDND
ncbi:MAG: hypothetical protein COA42_02065 [Alteromonadaceae bacterium]|nr:MAG: hypothetical protein COA42_02065 [Alteromonadaceae bacterium]